MIPSLSRIYFTLRGEGISPGWVSPSSLLHGVTVCVRNSIDKVKSFIKYAWNMIKQTFHYTCQLRKCWKGIHRGYQMDVGSILNLCILCKHLASIISFYSTSSINLVTNLHEFNILFITYPQKRTLNCKIHLFFIVFAYCVTLMFSALFYPIFE